MSEPTAAEDEDAHPLAQGQTAAESFNDALDDIPVAERSTAQVLEALLGTEPTRDLTRLIRGTARTADELSRYEQSLQDLITNLNVDDGRARGRVDEPARLDPRAAAARSPRPTARSTRSTPRSRRRARSRSEIRPGVRETPATIEAAFPWIEQTRALVQPEELGGLAEELSPATADLARLIDRATELLPAGRPAGQVRCATSCCPPGDLVVQDEFTNGEENYKEFFYALVGIAGEGQNFDGNGMYVRFQTGGGSQTLSLGPNSTSLGELFGNFIEAPLGNRPAIPTKKPTYKDDVPCHTQALPNVNGPAAAEDRAGGGRGDGRARSSRSRTSCARGRAAGRPQEAQPVRRRAEGRGEDEVKTAIRKHLPDFLAILGLLVVALVVSVYILDKQRLVAAGGRAGPGPGLLRARGRDDDRAGRHAGPGPDGQHRRASRWARSRRSSCATARRSSA